MTTWMHRREKWCSPWWPTVFTVGRTSNASGEANNAALKVAYEVGADTIVRLIMQTCERSSAMKLADRNASDVNYLRSCSSVSSLTKCEPMSLAGQLLSCRAAHYIQVPPKPPCPYPQSLIRLLLILGATTTLRIAHSRIPIQLQRQMQLRHLYVTKSNLFSGYAQNIALIFSVSGCLEMRYTKP